MMNCDSMTRDSTSSRPPPQSHSKPWKPRDSSVCVLRPFGLTLVVDRMPKYALGWRLTLLAMQVGSGFAIAHVLQAMPYWSIGA